MHTVLLVHHKHIFPILLLKHRHLRNHHRVVLLHHQAHRPHLAIAQQIVRVGKHRPHRNRPCARIKLSAQVHDFALRTKHLTVGQHQLQATLRVAFRMQAIVQIVRFREVEIHHHAAVVRQTRQQVTVVHQAPLFEGNASQDTRKRCTDERQAFARHRQSIVRLCAPQFCRSHTSCIVRHHLVVRQFRHILQVNPGLFHLRLSFGHFFVHAHGCNAEERLSSLHILSLAHIDRLQQSLLLRTNLHVALRVDVGSIVFGQIDTVHQWCSGGVSCFHLLFRFFLARRHRHESGAESGEPKEFHLHCREIAS